MNRVVPPEGPALAVVEGLHCADREGAGAVKGDHLRLVHGVVVKVAVAAQDFVAPQLPVRQGRVALHAGVGVQQNAIAVLLNQKAGMAQPGEFHMDILLVDI